MLLFSGLFGQKRDDNSTNNVRLPCKAGTWYPGDKEALARTVDDAIDQAQATDLPGRPLAIIAPHAGYRFCAPVSATAYKCIKDLEYKRVILLAFSHRYASSYAGVAIAAEQNAYRTPLGDVPIDRDACGQLLKSRAFINKTGVDRDEHSLELQIPFLQRTLNDFSIVPLYVGIMKDADYAAAAQAISRMMDEKTLLVVSSDFTHFGADFGYEPFDSDVPQNIRELANSAAAPLENADFDGFAAHLQNTKDTICGKGPILLLLRLLSMNHSAEGLRTGFDTSGNMLDDWKSSVTYQSFVFTPRKLTLTTEEQTSLLKLARETAKNYLANKTQPDIDVKNISPALTRDGACFVTLTNRGDLRGCIGTMVAAGPLYESVARNAVSACQDYRFTNKPVTARELDEIDIEISYLTPMKTVEDVSEIVIGRHGLLITLNAMRGVLLPQVAAERGWTREEFLEHTCRKAGLSPNDWKNKNAVLQSFEAEVFSEKKRN